MIVLDILIMCAVAYLVIAAGWLLMLTLASWGFRPKVIRNCVPLRFLAVIPAHNEALQIEQTINHIRNCDYSAELVDISVIADNCSDKTAEIAERSGTQVFQRTNALELGKGAALDWFLRLNADRLNDYDGIVFIDADSIPDKMLFRALSESLSHQEVSVVQGFNGVANPYDNWRTALNTAAFNLFNHLRMAGNERLFDKAFLKGLGMAFSPEILKEYGWPANSVVEDLEFTAILVEQGIGVRYNPEAIITSEMAVTREQADGQRKRWEGGRFSLARNMVPRLLAEIWRGRYRGLFILADLLILPLSLLVLLLLVSWIATWLFLPSAMVLVTAASCAIFFYVASGQFQRKASWKIWLFLAFFPIYLIWKLAVYSTLVVNPSSTVWRRTPRKSEIK